VGSVYRGDDQTELVGDVDPRRLCVGQVTRGLAALDLQVSLRAGKEQLVDDGDVALHGSRRQSGPTVSRCYVDVRSGFQ